MSVRYLAERVIQLADRPACGSSSAIVLTGRPVDDPQRRCPDIALARMRLGWAPSVSLDEGLARTIDWCRRYGWA